jgi:glutathione S-transferase
VIELFHAHISTCSQKVRLCLAEKGLAWTDHPLDFAKAEHLTPAYLALNPNGVVPTLVHDGRPVIDSSVICEYLERGRKRENTRDHTGVNPRSVPQRRCNYRASL